MTEPREIKFKAWDKANKKMLSGPKLNINLILSSEQYEPMQLTGLKDRNGTDLDWWEGDLFQFYLDSKYQIKFEDGAFWFVSDKGRQLCDSISKWADLPQKLGSIHDNLLKGAE